MNLNISSASKGRPQDVFDTIKYNMLSREKQVIKKSSSSEPAITSAPAIAPAPAPVVATVSPHPHDIINNKNNNVSSGSNKPPGCGWDTDTVKGWRTGTGKRGRRPTNTNITFITDPERRKELYGQYEHMWINFSKPPWTKCNRKNTERSFNAVEEQSRNLLHNNINVSKHDNETIDADNSYANSNECSSECSSECSYNHKSNKCSYVDKSK